MSTTVKVAYRDFVLTIVPNSPNQWIVHISKPATLSVPHQVTASTAADAVNLARAYIDEVTTRTPRLRSTKTSVDPA